VGSGLADPTGQTSTRTAGCVSCRRTLFALERDLLFRGLGVCIVAAGIALAPVELGDPGLPAVEHKSVTALDDGLGVLRRPRVLSAAPIEAAVALNHS
jgi:hypothetical protein